MEDVKKTISRRVYIVFLGLLFVGFAICAKLLKVQVWEQEYWLNLRNNTTKIDTIYGKRGNVYDINRNPLVTSLPHYDLVFDPTAAKIKSFDENIGEISSLIAGKFGKKSASVYEREFRDARKNNEKYIRIANKISLSDKKEIKTWPLFKENKNRGGGIFKKRNERIRPYGMLASRTLGMIRDNASDFGLEHAYDEYLSGGKMPKLKYNLPSVGWIEVDYNGEYPDDGNDIHTTIDVTIQEAANKALKATVEGNAANHGCAIVMDVETGEIRAIANYGRDAKGNYGEIYNYAIAESMMPGSTFKVPMLLALLMDKKASLNTLVDVGTGVKKFYDRVIKDTNSPAEPIMTLQSVIEKSSNVGIATMISESYSNEPKTLINRLNSFNLGKKCGIEIAGESSPLIPSPGNGTWSGVTLPYMAHGYEVKVTPLQLLTFYNAIANNGKLMRPYLVKKITNRDKVIKSFEPEVVKAICSERDAYNVQKVLRGIVKRGTAKKIASEYLTLAGKTGTTVISPPERASNKKYQASFVGYFPHENPKYSCIVVISDPRNGQYYGSAVAAPVFKEIAEKTFAKDIELQKIMGDNNKDSELAEAEFPTTKKGFVDDIEVIYDFVGTDYEIETNAPFVYSENSEGFIALKADDSFKTSVNIIPNVKNMGLRDAIYVLENIGLKVEISGIGKVLDQSKKPGKSFEKGELIKITLG